MQSAPPEYTYEIERMRTELNELRQKQNRMAELLASHKVADPSTEISNGNQQQAHSPAATEECADDQQNHRAHAAQHSNAEEGVPVGPAKSLEEQIEEERQRTEELKTRFELSEADPAMRRHAALLDQLRGERQRLFESQHERTSRLQGLEHQILTLESAVIGAAEHAHASKLGAPLRAAAAALHELRGEARLTPETLADDCVNASISKVIEVAGNHADQALEHAMEGLSEEERLFGVIKLPPSLPAVPPEIYGAPCDHFTHNQLQQLWDESTWRPARLQEGAVDDDRMDTIPTQSRGHRLG